MLGVSTFVKVSGFLAVVILLCACGTVPSSTGRSTVPASGSRTASPPGQVSPLPTFSPIPSPSGVASAQFPPCKLPYLKGEQADARLAGGFVQGSSGTWRADAAGVIRRSGDFLVTDAKPALKASALSSDDTGAYDLALKRWLPVRRAQIRSDGLAYAYAEPYKAKTTDLLYNATRIHVISLLNGSDRVIYSGAPRGVMSYEVEGIYITAVGYYHGEGGSGLWRLDPKTGASTRIANVEKGWLEAVDRGIAWTDGATIMPRSLIRLNLSSGSQQTWADVGDEGWITFIGLDSNGHPLVVLHPFGTTTSSGVLLVYKAPTVRVPIANLDFSRPSVTDGHGTWLAAQDGVYLLDARDRLTKVSDVTGGNVAGGCS